MFAVLGAGRLLPILATGEAPDEPLATPTGMLPSFFVRAHWQSHGSATRNVLIEEAVTDSAVGCAILDRQFARRRRPCRPLKRLIPKGLPRDRLGELHIHRPRRRLSPRLVLKTTKAICLLAGPASATRSGFSQRRPEWEPEELTWRSARLLTSQRSEQSHLNRTFGDWVRRRPVTRLAAVAQRHRRSRAQPFPENPPQPWGLNSYVAEFLLIIRLRRNRAGDTSAIRSR